jgi:hypothetical protein
LDKQEFDSIILTYCLLNGFEENRPFFTEGTDLFSKGLFFIPRKKELASAQVPTLANEEYEQVSWSWLCSHSLKKHKYILAILTHS